MNKNLKKSLLLIFIPAILSFSCEGQDSISDKTQTSVSLQTRDSVKWTIYKLQDKCELQKLELSVLKDLKKVDSNSFKNDSIVISFIGENDQILKTVKRGFGKDRSNMKDIRNAAYYGDSVITYFNDNGLLYYQEKWQETYRISKQSPPDTTIVWSKMSYRRYEYDDQNRLTRQLIYYPTPMLAENTFTYDAPGNVTKGGGRIDERDFWGSVRETLQK